MSYAYGTRRETRTLRPETGRTSVHAGALTYLGFGLALGFSAAIVLGLVA